MSTQELERLIRKYYGYVGDLEGSGVEALDLLFVRDKIQRILDESTPESAIPHALYDRIFELDRWLWEEQESFLTVVGVEELQYARQQQGSRRSHWWWYLDELAAPPQPFAERQERLAQALAG
ncbi:MAG: hypothetical protein DCC55_20730 [Chloroflexi bacterium]|nr:MAG: hypothetical protein DCC55_20730 [Chloroflexota bacterium]